MATMRASGSASATGSGSVSVMGSGSASVSVMESAWVMGTVTMLQLAWG